MNWDGSPVFGTGYLLVDSNPSSINVPTFPTQEIAGTAAVVAGWRVVGKIVTCPNCRDDRTRAV